MSALVFLDTETTGLLLDDEVWEFAAIRREASGEETTYHWFVEHDRDRCRQLPESFRSDHFARYRDHEALTQREFAFAVKGVMEDRPHVVGAVPNFDTVRLEFLLARHSLSADWHYHLIDVENLAVGYLHGLAAAYPAKAAEIPPLPWDSDALSRAIGVEPPAEEQRHTALGDARWAMRLYDAVTGSGLALVMACLPGEEA